MFYRRHLPHWIPEASAIFVTWRLAGVRKGSPCLLRDPRVADMVARAVLYGAGTRGLYALNAWVVMPDHVHLVIDPYRELADTMRWLKGTTGRRANRLLGRTGVSFWQTESYDHWIRTPEELDSTIGYVEANPVRAGLAASETEWRWSSAGWND